MQSAAQSLYVLINFLYSFTLRAYALRRDFLLEQWREGKLSTMYILGRTLAARICLHLRPASDAECSETTEKLFLSPANGVKLANPGISSAPSADRHFLPVIIPAIPVG